MNLFYVHRCPGGLQWDNICIRADFIRKNPYHGGKFALSVPEGPELSAKLEKCVTAEMSILGSFKVALSSRAGGGAGL